MPLARIEVEQIEASRWVAEIEAGGTRGGPPFKRTRLNNMPSFEAVMAEVARLYYQQVPPPAPGVQAEPVMAVEPDPAEMNLRPGPVEPAEAPKRRGRPPKAAEPTE